MEIRQIHNGFGIYRGNELLVSVRKLAGDAITVSVHDLIALHGSEIAPLVRECEQMLEGV